MDVPWYGWIAIIGVVVWGVIAITGGISWGRGRKEEALAEAMRDNAAINKALLEKLDDIDGRLGAVEKTLNDIP